MPIVTIADVVQFNRDFKGFEGTAVYAHLADSFSPAELIKELLHELADDFPEVKFCLGVDSTSNLASAANIAQVPTVIVQQNRVEVGRVEGPDPKAVVTLLRETVAGKYSKKVAAEPLKRTPEELHKLLKQLTTAEPVVLFMKGSKKQPFCKFSRAAVEILNSSEGIEYATFDILKDNEIREGLKSFSKWPTFPQLYVEGELVGGVDIMREMQEQDQLQPLLKDAVTKGKGALEIRLRALVKEQPIMLFMKGSPQKPYCGFSRKMVDILAMVGVKYMYFDVLLDPEVREGLKELYKWPTFPQLYCNGILIGGLDVVEQLIQQGGPDALLAELQTASETEMATIAT